MTAVARSKLLTSISQPCETKTNYVTVAFSPSWQSFAHAQKKYYTRDWRRSHVRVCDSSISGALTISPEVSESASRVTATKPCNTQRQNNKETPGARYAVHPGTRLDIKRVCMCVCAVRFFVFLSIRRTRVIPLIKNYICWTLINYESKVDGRKKRR